jgi:hypothetical protein
MMKSKYVWSEGNNPFPKTNYLPSSDVELPADCDDEYWEHPDAAQTFKQPQGKPSTIACFIAYIKLQKIMIFALRTIVRRFLCD